MIEKIKSIILYILGFGTFCLFFKTKIILWLILSIGSIILASFSIKKKKVTMYTLLIMYFIGLMYYLFYEPLFARSGLLDIFDFEEIGFLWDHIKSSTNIVPFKTISFYIKEFLSLSSNVDTDALFLNVFGNILCLMPLAILLPLCNDKYKKYKNYLVILLIISLMIELGQLITMNGAFDIDDILLNSGGAIIAFFLVNPDINILISNILFNEKNKVNIKKIVINVLIIVTAFIMLLILFIYRDRKESEYINHISGYDIKLEMKNTCYTKEKNYLYEDNVYRYYLTCGKADESFVYINDEKYTLEEYFSGNLEYIIYIDRLIYEGLDVLKEEKLEKLVVCEKGDLIGTIYVSENDPIHFIDKEPLQGKESTCLQYYIKPLRKGTMELKVVFKKGETKKIDRFFNFKVDEDLNVTYEEIER